MSSLSGTFPTNLCTSGVAVGIDVGPVYARIAAGNTLGGDVTATDFSTAYNPPNVVSNAQGDRFTLAISAAEDGVKKTPAAATAAAASTEEDGEPKAATVKRSFLYGDALRRALAREKLEESNYLMRKMCMEKSSEDSMAASAAFFQYFASLACDATSAIAADVRVVLSMPVDAATEYVEGLVDAAQRGLEQAVAEAPAPATTTKKSKKKTGNAGGAAKTPKTPPTYVVATLSEPAAVAIAHGLSHVLDEKSTGNRIRLADKESSPPVVEPAPGQAIAQWSNALIVDWNEGRLTVSHLKHTTTGLLVVEKSASDDECSGQQFVQLLVKFCVSQFERRNKGVTGLMDNKKARWRLEWSCADAVRTLTRSTQVTVTADSLYEGLDLSVPVSRPRFDMLCAPLLKKALDLMQSFGEASQFDVVLTSGSVCLIPNVEALVAKTFPDAWRGRGADVVPPDEAIVMGCATHASLLMGPHTRFGLYGGGLTLHARDEAAAQAEAAAAKALETGEELLPKKKKKDKVDTGLPVQTPHSTTQTVQLSPVSIGICRNNDLTNAVTIIPVGTPLPANVTRLVELTATTCTPTANGEGHDAAQENGVPDTIDSIGIVQMPPNTPKLVGRIDSIKDAKHVEIAMELSTAGKLTIAVDGNEPVTMG